MTAAQSQSGKASQQYFKTVQNLITKAQQSLATPVQNIVLTDTKNLINPFGDNIKNLTVKPLDATSIDSSKSTHQIDYPDDPQKGKWGGRSEVNGRKISATITKKSFSKFFTVVITITSTDTTKPLTGDVSFIYITLVYLLQEA